MLEYMSICLTLGVGGRASPPRGNGGNGSDGGDNADGGGGDDSLPPSDQGQL